MFRKENLKSTSHTTTKRLFSSVARLAMLALLAAPAFGHVRQLHYGNAGSLNVAALLGFGGQPMYSSISPTIVIGPGPAKTTPPSPDEPPDPCITKAER